LDVVLQKLLDIGEKTGVSFAGIVLALVVVILAFRSPVILNTILSFLNDRKRIVGSLELKNKAHDLKIKTLLAKRLKKRENGK